MAIPLTIFLTQQEQDIRQEAADSPAPRACVAGNTDTFLVIDRSNSMRKETSNKIKTPRINFAKRAAVLFVNTMSQETTNYIGVAQFGKNGGTPQNLTNNYTQVKNAINKLEAEGPIGTCLECAILAVNERITERIKSGNTNKKFVVILSDGNANVVRKGDGSLSDIDKTVGIRQARQAILAGHRNNGTVFYTIGLGQENNSDGREFLKEVAAATKGKYFFAANASQLEQIYQEIALTVGKVSVSGKVFEDKDTNGIFDPKVDASMSGVTVNLKLATPSASTPNNGLIETTKSNENGQYTFSNLCADMYHVEQEEQDGYYLTKPENPPYHVIDADKSSADFTDKNFGNAKGEVSFTFKFALHGIGIAGDNVLQRPGPCQNFGFNEEACLSNQNPRHPNRKFTVEVIDSVNKAVATISGTMTYNGRVTNSSNSGIFTADEKVETGLKRGKYTFKVHTPMYLKKNIIFDEEIELNKTYDLPLTDLTSSDVETVSSPNRLTVLDYNMIVRCYTPPTQTRKSCNPTDAQLVDTDDNG